MLSNVPVSSIMLRLPKQPSIISPGSSSSRWPELRSRLFIYKGTPAAMLAVVSGEVKMGFGMVPVALQHVNAGKLRAYAITSNKRFSGLPDVPTSAEAGLPGFESDYWIGMLAPARTPGRSSAS